MNLDKVKMHYGSRKLISFSINYSEEKYSSNKIQILIIIFSYFNEFYDTTKF